jgi:hypothetical protein
LSRITFASTTVWTFANWRSTEDSTASDEGRTESRPISAGAEDAGAGRWA